MEILTGSIVVICFLSSMAGMKYLLYNCAKSNDEPVINIITEEYETEPPPKYSEVVS